MGQSPGKSLIAGSRARHRFQFPIFRVRCSTMIGSTAALHVAAAAIPLVTTIHPPTSPSRVPSTHTYVGRAFLKFTDAINVTAGSSGGRSLRCRPFVGLTVTNFAPELWPTVALRPVPTGCFVRADFGGRSTPEPAPALLKSNRLSGSTLRARASTFRRDGVFLFGRPSREHSNSRHSPRNECTPVRSVSMKGIVFSYLRFKCGKNGSPRTVSVPP